jgi:hypothetical protein
LRFTIIVYCAAAVTPVVGERWKSLLLPLLFTDLLI